MLQGSQVYPKDFKDNARFNQRFYIVIEHFGEQIWFIKNYTRAFAIFFDNWLKYLQRLRNAFHITEKSLMKIQLKGLSYCKAFEY